MASLGVSGLLLGLTMVVLMLISPAHSLTCTSQTFSNSKSYEHCNDLSQLSSFLHWAYNSTNSSISIAFVAPPADSDGWVAWGINPTGTKMAGSQAFIAFKDSNDTMTVKTYNISSYQSIVQSKLSFDVWDMSADSSAGLMRIFASMKVPEKATTVNQIWQVGSVVTNGIPMKHEFKPANLNALGTLDLEKGQNNNTTGTGGSSRAEKKNIHGILNAVSWGILFPIGVIIARYLRTFQSADPAWFYLHIFCQSSAYALGVAGWATGLKLGSESKGIQFTGHRNIGIALFSLATVQIFALFLRPKKDHKYRTYWNVYHHSVGYAILVLGIINVFKGLDILDPAKKWKSAYIVVIAALGVIALLLEAVTWIVVLKMKKSDKSTKPHDGFNG